MADTTNNPRSAHKSVGMRRVAQGSSSAGTARTAGSTGTHTVSSGHSTKSAARRPVPAKSSSSAAAGTAVKKTAPAKKQPSLFQRAAAATKASSASRASSASKTSSAKKTGGNKGVPTKKIIYWVGVLIVVAIIALVCVIGYRKAYNIFYDVAIDPSDTSKVEYTIDDTTTKEDIENFLVSNGFVKDLQTLKAREKLYSADYQDGTYKISKSFTTEKIINILSGYDYSDGTMEE